MRTKYENRSHDFPSGYRQHAQNQSRHQQRAKVITQGYGQKQKLFFACTSYFMVFITEVNTGLKPSCIASSMCSSLSHWGSWWHLKRSWQNTMSSAFTGPLPCLPPSHSVLEYLTNHFFPWQKLIWGDFCLKLLHGSPYGTSSLVHPVSSLNKEPTPSKSRRASKTACKANVNRDEAEEVGELLVESGWEMAEEWEWRGQMHVYSVIPCSGVISCSQHPWAYSLFVKQERI